MRILDQYKRKLTRAIRKINIAYLTGEAIVVENGLLNDRVIMSSPSRNIGQMFFKPYQSKKEFIYCARNTLYPLGIFMLGANCLIGCGLMSGLCLGVALYCESQGAYRVAFKVLEYAVDLMAGCLQLCVDLAVFPLSALILMTRMMSTGLNELLDSLDGEEKEMLRAAF
ncbi:MAG: hypothetical protein CK426_02580 [Legionella sp.]|nr:MAG: hypothetical protein CK423_03380 [Legionella sp.]PJD99682.1 MAG: hypothetical protein CK426_02580 [Legionella sp.]